MWINIHASSWLAAASFIILNPMLVTIACYSSGFLSALKQAQKTPLDPVTIWEKICNTSAGSKSLWFQQFVFSRILMIASPFTNSINMKVISMTKGNIKCSLQQCGRLSNPFNSIHACAIGLLVETTAGLCLFSVLDHKLHRAILVRLDVEYMQKTRGNVIAHCCLPEAEVFCIRSGHGPNGEKIVETRVIVTNAESDDVLVRAVASWRLSQVSNGTSLIEYQHRRVEQQKLI